jgi:hypothetical protein
VTRTVSMFTGVRGKVEWRMSLWGSWVECSEE